MVSEVLGEQLARARTRRGWTQKQLAEVVAAHGGSINRAAIAKIESGVRGVSLDEWLVLAAAVNVPPPVLLLPLGGEERVHITDRAEIHPHLALDWLTGEEPLASTDRYVIKRSEWLSGAAPMFLFQQLRKLQDDVRHASFEVYMRDRSARDLGGLPELTEEEKRRAWAQYEAALIELHRHLRRMQEAAIRPPGITQRVLKDMRAFGLDTTDLPESDASGEWEEM